jgi:hypothetical protein
MLKKNLCSPSNKVLEKFTEGDQTVVIVDILEHVTALDKFTLLPEPAAQLIAGAPLDGKNRIRFNGDPGYHIGQKITVSEIL